MTAPTGGSRLRLPDGPLTVACVAAHPDDVEIGCGGTLLGLAGRGDLTAHWLTLTGTDDRVAEAKAAAQAFCPGATSTFGEGFTDGYLPERWGEVKRTLHAFAAGITPDIVFVPWAGDAHQDHRLIAELAPTVWRSSLLLHYEIPKWDGDIGRPSLYVPMDEATAARKVELLDASYVSQRTRDWWDVELFLGYARTRGMEAKTRYAEAFHLTKAVLTL
ncbi:MAG: PIG-L family deacetylase [Micrococcales bacterium]|nr:PIG-L family deacetylase [Micrococcales bacterium]